MAAKGKKFVVKNPRPRQKRELLLAWQWSGSDVIRTFGIPYRFLPHLLWIGLLILMGGLYFALDYTSRSVFAPPQGGLAGYYDSSADISDEDLDVDILRYEFQELLENVDELVDNQLYIYRSITAEAEENDQILNQMESRLATLELIRKQAQNRELFIPGRYLRRRLGLHRTMVGLNQGLGRFYYKHMFPLPHRYPVHRDHFKVNSPYGKRRKPGWGPFGPIQFHRGIDLYGRRGDPVYATARGKVKLARYGKYGYGNIVKIKHPSGYVTLYAHLRNIFVKQGQFIRAGEVIGEVGATGNVTGPHLHYEIFKGKNRINPGILLGTE